MRISYCTFVPCSTVLDMYSDDISVFYNCVTRAGQVERIILFECIRIVKVTTRAEPSWRN